MAELAGRHVFIAGGSRGIGAATARLAARAGADVAINYLRNTHAAAIVARDVESSGRSSVVVRADVSQDGEADRAVEQAAERLGPLWGMVVCAGIFEGCPIERMSVEFWDRTMAVNLRGTFLCVRAAARHMRASGRGGSIVILTSTAGQRGSEVYSAYAASKGAQILFMRSMARELASDGIRVNCVAPAWTDTDMAAPSLNEMGRDEVARSFPLGRIGLPEDVARPTVFLLSDAASFITGTTLTVDGGMDMRG